jgi:hypothetical protein
LHGAEYIRDGDTLLAILVRANARSAAKYNFLTAETAPLQLGVNFYAGGEKIPAHAHVPRQIQINQIQEVLLIGHGMVRLSLYNENKLKVSETELNAGDLVLLITGGHGLDVLEDTKIVEVKQGPYDGRVKDKIAL